MNETYELLNKLLTIALRLTETDCDNSDRHQRIADSLTRYGRRQFGPRFGDGDFRPAQPAQPGPGPDEPSETDYEVWE